MNDRGMVHAPVSLVPGTQAHSKYLASFPHVQRTNNQSETTGDLEDSSGSAGNGKAGSSR